MSTKPSGRYASIKLATFWIGNGNPKEIHLDDCHATSIFSQQTFSKTWISGFAGYSGMTEGLYCAFTQATQQGKEFIPIYFYIENTENEDFRRRKLEEIHEIGFLKTPRISASVKNHFVDYWTEALVNKKGWDAARIEKTCKNWTPDNFINNDIETLESLLKEPEFAHLKGFFWNITGNTINDPAIPKAIYTGIVKRELVIHAESTGRHDLTIVI